MIFVYSSSNLQTSVDSLKAEIEKNPDDYLLHYNLGMCYYALNMYEDALAAFNHSLSLNKNQRLPVLKSILVYGYLGAYEKMIEICESELQKLENPDFFLLYECGIANAMLGRYNTAIDLYNEALSIATYTGPDNIELQLAMIYFCNNDTTKGERLFNQTLQRVSRYGNKPHVAIWHYWYGNFDNAYTTQSKMKKKYSTDHYNLGVYQIASGDVNGLETLKGACDEDKTGFVRAIYEAIVNIRCDSLAIAECILKQDIPERGYSGMANGLLAWTLEKLGKDKEAKQYWFKCYGRLPLGINVEMMRNFINDFLTTLGVDIDTDGKQ